MGKEAKKAGIFSFSSEGDKRSAVFMLACLIMFMYLFAAYNFAIRERFEDAAAINFEINARLRILDIKERNLSALPENLAAIEEAKSHSAAQNAEPVFALNLPEAVMNVSDLMIKHGITEDEFIIHNKVYYNDGTSRQPLSVYGAAGYKSVFEFIDSLQNNIYMYDIDSISITRNEAETGSVSLRMAVSILIMEGGSTDRAETGYIAYDFDKNPFEYR